MVGQNRNRDTQKYLDNGVKFVDDKFDALGVISVFGHALEKDGVITGFAFTGPEGTNVEKVLKEMPKDYFNRLVEASYLDHKERKTADQKQKTHLKAKKDKKDHVVKTCTKVELARPKKPIYMFNEVDMRTFFPRFIRSVLTRENICMKGKNLWATRRKDSQGSEVIIPPVRVPFWNKHIIRPSQYFGHGKKYKESIQNLKKPIH